MKSSFLSRSEQETIRYGLSFAKTLTPGNVLALSGGLGSGKTTFVKGVALGLGLKNADEVKSPTFVLMHHYPTKISMYHFDLYRLENENDFEGIDLEGTLNDAKAISCVEWGEKAKDLFPAGTYFFKFERVSEHVRKITILKSPKNKMRQGLRKEQRPSEARKRPIPRERI